MNKDDILTNNFAAQKVSRDFVWKYHVKSYERHKAEQAWKHCEIIGKPLNTLIEFEFEQGQDPRNDVELVRRLARWTRVAIRNMGIESYMIWSRHVALGRSTERVALLAHVPENNFKGFSAQAQGWNFGRGHTPIRVTRVGYERSIEVNGKLYTPFDWVLRNMDPVTKRHQPEALFEQSEPLFKPVVFQSLKIDGQARYTARSSVIIDN